LHHGSIGWILSAREATPKPACDGDAAVHRDRCNGRTSSPSAGVRITAARGIAAFDRLEGVALLKRELDNRDPSQCAHALIALNELTDHHYTFDFLIPAERQQAIATYAAIDR
jgi:hypothetical protein